MGHSLGVVQRKDGSKNGKGRGGMGAGRLTNASITESPPTKSTERRVGICGDGLPEGEESVKVFGIGS
jgi:hypothetical protein